MEVEIEAWRVEVERQLKAIEQDVMGHEPSGRKLAQLWEELKILACVVAWYREQGSITRAAERRGTSRKVLRAHVKIWAQRHPQLVPDRPKHPKRPRGVHLSAEQEAKRAEAREKDNARHRARRAKLRAERSERAAQGGVEATAAKGAGRS